MGTAKRKVDFASVAEQLAEAKAKLDSAHRKMRVLIRAVELKQIAQAKREASK